MSHLRHLTNELESSQSKDKMPEIIFDIIFRHIQDMVFVMKVEPGPNFRYLFINESAIRKANLSMEVIGKSLQEVLSLEFANKLQEKYKSLLSKRDIVIYDDHYYHNSGKEIYGETILTPIYSETNTIQYIVAVTRDVTERSIEKKRMIESEQRYRSIVDHNLDAILTITPEGKILEANPAAASMTGFSIIQLSNRSFYEIIYDADIEKFMELLERTVSGFALESFDCKILHRKGHMLLTQIRTVPIVIHGDIKGLYIILKDLSEQVKNMEMIKFMAFHDQLTGLFNRRALLDHLNDRIFSPIKKAREFALFSIDIDRFKYLNDTLGHLAGDEILKTVADRLSQFQNEACFIYRVGGDEFNILLADADRQSAASFVSKVFEAFSKSFYFNSQEYYISPSIGISMYPNDGRDAEMLIKNADEALFRVKEKGKGHFQFYRSDMNTVITNIVTLETHMRKAIENNELSIYYQPQVDLNTGQAKSFEALLRWHDNEFGSIPPSDFIPLAEDTGLIIPIGYWAIQKVCQQLRRWNQLGYGHIRVAINISPKQFQHPNLVPFFQSMINRYNIDPASLEIEITEGAMNDTKETLPILKKLKEIGVSISVDDFGTGYSSLNYLKQFPIDSLKIDQSFIKDILSDEKDAAITSTIIHLGKSLGLEVVAEGVEEKQQVDFLTDANCHKIQGFYYSKPIPANLLEERFLCLIKS